MALKDESTSAKGLRADPKNARIHPTENKQMIRRSLEEVGGFRSIAVDGDDIVRAGNGVFEQANALGMKVRVIEAAPDELIAVKRPDLHGDAAIRAALYDNAASDKSAFDAVVIEDIVQNERHLLDGILNDSDLMRILEGEDRKRTDMVDLGYDHEQGDGFSEGEQFKNGELYTVLITVPVELANSMQFKEDLRMFCSQRNLSFKLRLA